MGGCKLQLGQRLGQPLGNDRGNDWNTGASNGATQPFYSQPPQHVTNVPETKKIFERCLALNYD